MESMVICKVGDDNVVSVVKNVIVVDVNFILR